MHKASYFIELLSQARIVVLVCSLCLGFPISAFATNAPAVPGQYLIKFKNTTSRSTQPNMRLRLAVSVVKRFQDPNLQLVQTFSGNAMEKRRAKELLASGAVDYIEPNYIVHATVTPNDSHYNSLWGLHNTGQSGGTANSDIDAPEAWDSTTGSEEIVVGVVDTGIDYEHADLAANMWVNEDEIPDNEVDDDDNGYVDDVYGWNAVENNGDPMDDHNHGTHVAGTIGAVGNNGFGVVGVNWNVRLMGLKFLGSNGSGTTAGAIAAIQYAVAQKNNGVNVRVLNNSWGGGGYSQGLFDAIAAANTAGILFVAAAGNASSDNDSVAAYPANYNVANVISVAATDRNGNLASFSNYGLNKVHIGAPGHQILSTVRNGGYASYSGTSMATPHVAGVAALLLSHTNFTTANLKARLLNTAKRMSSLAGKVREVGMINANRAILNIVSPIPQPSVRYNQYQIQSKYKTARGTRVLGTGASFDDAYVIRSLPFSFSYYGKSCNRIAISSNGRVVPLGAEDSAPTRADFQNSLVDGIHPYHTDFFPRANIGQAAGVWFKSNANAVTVTWISAPYAYQNMQTASHTQKVQLKMFKNGYIEFHYADTHVGNVAFDYGARATIGLAPVSGVYGNNVLVSHNTRNIAQVGNSKAIQFRPVSDS